jgi:hypothetical protein
LVNKQEEIVEAQQQLLLLSVAVDLKLKEKEEYFQFVCRRREGEGRGIVEAQQQLLLLSVAVDLNLKEKEEYFQLVCRRKEGEGGRRERNRWSTATTALALRRRGFEVEGEGGVFPERRRRQRKILTLCL